MKWLSRRRNIVLMLAPAFLVYSLYFTYPIIYSVFQSFTDARAFGSSELVGFFIPELLTWRSCGLPYRIKDGPLLSLAFSLTHRPRL